MASVDFSIMTAKQKARYMINEYMQAEIAVLGSAQSYSMSGKTLTRANLADIRAGRKYWENQLAILNNKSARKVKQIHVRN